jgi:hypothetical protein
MSAATLTSMYPLNRDIKFAFDRVFDSSATQQDIFEFTAKYEIHLVIFFLLFKLLEQASPQRSLGRIQCVSLCIWSHRCRLA